MKHLLVLLVLIIIGYCNNNNPVAIFHGLGDACALESVTGFPKFIQEQLGGDSYVKCIESGPSVLSIILKSFESQAEQACEKLKEDPQFLNKKITVIGLSQGSLIARYIAQKCDFGGEVEFLVSIGGPNMGVNGVPHCGFDSNLCSIINKFIGKYLVYSSLAQKLVGPAGYYRDAFNLQLYDRDSTFLAALNNERDFDQNSKDKFMKIQKLILIKFDQDTMIIPKETAWFQAYKPGTTDVVPMEQTDLYLNDLIGLKYLQENQKVYRYSVQGDHLQISHQQLIEYVINNIRK